MSIRHVLALFLSAALTACAAPRNLEPAQRSEHMPIPPGLASQIDAILERSDAGAMAVGVLRNNRLALARYGGTERPGIRVDETTRFEIASVTKMVATETALRLVAKGLLDLDEPLADYWVDPDLSEDPRRAALTARHVLTHRTGFPNWRFFREDRKLAFESDPGERYGYSGEGFNYLGKALEIKLGKPFPRIVLDEVFSPLGIDNAVMENLALETDFAMLRDPEGTLYSKHCRPGFCFEDGGWSAAGGLAITLEDFAKILAAVGTAEAYDSRLRIERDTVVSDEGDAQLIFCDQNPDRDCPIEQGYGLGLQVERFSDRIIVGHSGGDWSTLSVAYIDPATGNGVIVFLTGPVDRTAPTMVDLLRAADPQSPYLPKFEARVARLGS